LAVFSFQTYDKKALPMGEAFFYVLFFQIIAVSRFTLYLNIDQCFMVLMLYLGGFL